MNKQIALQRTRMYAALRESHPLYFGDPLEFHRSQLAGFSGTAYEQRNGGGAGLIGAVLAVATGGASLGFATLASTLTTISLVGSVVGAVTGNKAFSTIGAIAGLGSTFMSLSSAGTFGDGMKQWAGDTNASIMGTTTQSAAPVSDAIVNNVSDAGVQGADTVSQATAAGGNSNMLSDANLQNASGIIDTPTSSSLNTLTGNAAAGTTPTVPGVDAIANGVAPGAPAITGTPVATGVNPALAVGDAAAATGAPVTTATPRVLSAAEVANQKEINTGTSLFDKISEFANKNKVLTEVALKGIQGMYVSPQDKAYKEAQAASANAAAGLYDAKTAEIQGQIANANAVPNVNGMQVNPNAQIYNKPAVVAAGVRPAGLIQTRSV